MKIYRLWQEALSAVAMTAMLMGPIWWAVRNDRRREQAKRRHPSGGPR